jgi:hypothetical protein
MALKITKQIGTNRGITDSAYIRIVNYSINKYGYLQLTTQMFLTEEQASTPLDQIVSNMECFNYEVDNSFKIPLTKTLTRTVNKIVMVDEEYEKKTPIMDENGIFTNNFTTETSTQKVPKQMDVEEEYQVPDLSLIENQDIFAYGYTALKTKLIETFGAENIIDC